MIRVMVVKKDEAGKAVFLYGGESIEQSLRDVLGFFEGSEEIKTLNCKNPTELFEKLGLK